MSQSIDDKFNKIIADAIGQADGIKCSAEDYRENLKVWIDEIKTAIGASEESDRMNESEG